MNDRPRSRRAAARARAALRASSAVAALAALGACNALLGLDAVEFDESGSGGNSATSSSGGSAGEGGEGGEPSTTTTSSGGSGGVGGSGGGQPCEPGTVEACYSGTPGTEGKGDCKGGTRECDADGVGFGPCEGEVVDEFEICGDDDDDNCDAVVACEGKFVSGGKGGASSTDKAVEAPIAIAVDAAGNTIVAGVFLGESTFGGETLVSVSEPPLFEVDLFVVKYDPAGNVLWAKRFGDSAREELNGLAVDSAGNVLVTGSFYGSVNFSGEPSTALTTTILPEYEGTDGFGDGFVAKLDPDGGHLWSFSLADDGKNLPAVVTAVDVDASDNVVIGGTFLNLMRFPDDYAIQMPGFLGGFIAKLDPSGERLWAFPVGGSEYEVIMDVDVGQNGDIAVAAHCATSFTFPTGVGQPCPTPANHIAVAVAKLSPVGTPHWVSVLPGAGQNWVAGVALAPNGDVFVSGEMRGSLGSESMLLADSDADPVNGAEGFAAALDGTSGNLRWTKGFAGGPGRQRAVDVQVDDGGAVYVVGDFIDGVDLGSGEPTASTGFFDAFLVRLDPATGATVWGKKLGGLANEFVGTDVLLFFKGYPVGHPIATPRGTAGGVSVVLRTEGFVDLGFGATNQHVAFARFSP